MKCAESRNQSIAYAIIVSLSMVLYSRLSFLFRSSHNLNNSYNILDALKGFFQQLRLHPLIALTLLVALLFFPKDALAATVYGPELFTRVSGSPVVVLNDVDVTNSGTYTLQITNGGLEDDVAELVSSSIIKINGVQVVGPSEFNQNATYIEKEISLSAGTNELSVELKGKPGGGISISIIGEDTGTDDDGDGVDNSLDLCPTTPAGETVDANGCSDTQLDDDADGVSNAADLCPATPAGETVDANGCSDTQLDDDADGVNNATDTCPATPAGETVDANGCSDTQLDDDADGVNNAIDQCLATPAGETVDANGCSDTQLDDDGDGVNNATDICPATPAGEAVDASGCSDTQLDDDSDGVNNAIDLCPTTPAGETVDANGCSDTQLDTDGDGVNDALDLCPATPTRQLPVDADGCSAWQRDTDGDGVSDASDQCPSTPTGETVNVLGCSATEWDSDNDGVNDAFDFCPATPAGAAVDANGCSDTQLDDDADGVSNAIDQCPTTPAGEAVDANGCSDTQLDDDSDGVNNALDSCPATPAGETVDANGCSDTQLDDDSDGVNNATDICPATPAGETVDANGCSNTQLDDDTDGVSNAVDLCPATPTGETVDANGCSITQLDSDGDGVSDALDNCPATPVSEAVDADGCGDSQIPPTVRITSPQTLTTIGVSPVDVTGTVSDDATSLFVNGIQASVVGGNFTVSGIVVTEGMNVIGASAYDDFNNVGTDNVAITLDSTPPRVFINSPEDGAVVTSSPITVTGLINDLVRGTVNPAQASVTVNGFPATIDNRTFIVESVPLVEGSNIISAVGVDQTGNIATIDITVTLDLSIGKSLDIVSGNNQQAPIGLALAQPLVVSVTDEASAPISGALVIFEIIENNGSLNSTERAIAVETDAGGLAQATYTLGTWAGSGNNKVKVTSTGISGSITFVASGATATAANIHVSSGGRQRGAVSQPVPHPLVAIVTDVGYNCVDNVPITFTVISGSGTFSNGQSTITINSDSDGRSAASMTLGSEEGDDIHIVQADFAGNTGSPASFVLTGLLSGDPGQTSVSGVVLDNSNNPVPGVTMLIEGTTRQGVTDSEGIFTITSAPVGPIHLLADGSTATIPGEYPTLGFELINISGQDNTLGMPIYLLALDITSAATVGGAEDVLYTLDEVPGFSLMVKAGSVTFPDGSTEGQISVTQVHADKIPMTPPNGMQPRFIITIQPPGAVFDPPAPITLPNVDGLGIGEVTNLYSFDHDLGEFVSIGTGTVSDDGSIIESDPGVGIVKAGWACGGPPLPDTGNTGGGGVDDIDNPECVVGSIIETQNQALGEKVSITGTPFSMYYNSYRVQGRKRTRRTLVNGAIREIAGASVFDARDMGLGGWSLDVHHYFDFPAKLYYGNGSRGSARNVNTSTTNNDFIVLSGSGAMLYIFDGNNQRHLRTEDALTRTVIYSFTYDGVGLLTGVTDRDGNTTVIERVGGVPSAIVGPDGQRTSFALDANGYLASVTGPIGDPLQYAYNNEGLMTSFTDANGGLHTFAYDSVGRLLKDTNPAGGFWALSRNLNNDYTYSVSMSSALGRTSNYYVDKNIDGSILRTNTGPSGLQVITDVKADKTSTTTYPDGTVVTALEKPDPRWGSKLFLPGTSTITTPGGLTLNRDIIRSVVLTDPDDPFSVVSMTNTSTVNGRVSTSVYDAATLTTTNTSPGGRQSVNIKNPLGRIVSTQMIGVEPINYTYDLRGRFTGSTQGSGVDARTITTTYDASGNVASITDPMSQTTGFSYDLAGRISSVTLPDGRVIGYTYDANGNLTAITPPGRPTHIFNFNSADLRADYTAPDAGTGADITTYGYNLDKQLTTITRPDGQTVNFGFDTGGRMSAITIPRGTLNYAYDAATDNLSTITAPDGATLSYTYDGFLLTSETFSGTVNGSVSATYNNDFRVSTRSVNGGNTIGFTYNNDSLLVGIGSLDITRDAPTGFITGTTLGSTTSTIIRNTFGEMDSYDASYGATALFTASYTRDKLGRITDKVESIGGVTDTYAYTYDTAGRLTDVTKNAVSIGAYTYDTNSNRTSYTGALGSFSATYDAQDTLLTYGANSYAYTANGELASKTNASGTTTYSHETLGNILSVTLPDTTIIGYVIDGRNRRTGKKVNGTLVQGFIYGGRVNPIAELDGAGNVVSRFVYGTKGNVPDYMVKGGVTYRIVSDHLGSSRLVVDSTSGTGGTIVQRIDYDEFGNIINDTNPGFQPFGFAGGIYDQHTKLTRFGARDYDAETGRWTAKDPIRFAGGDTNLYGYVMNDPVNFVDPWGLDGSDPDSEDLSYDYWNQFLTDEEVIDFIANNSRMQDSFDIINQDFDRLSERKGYENFREGRWCFGKMPLCYDHFMPEPPPGSNFGPLYPEPPDGYPPSYPSDSDNDGTMCIEY